jgi:hypothetical protein
MQDDHIPQHPKDQIYAFHFAKIIQQTFHLAITLTRQHKGIESKPKL